MEKDENKSEVVEEKVSEATEEIAKPTPYKNPNRGLMDKEIETSATEESDEKPDEDQGVIQKKLVRLYQLQNNWALIDGSLQDEERIVVEGTHRVVSGQQVKVLDVTTQLNRPGQEAAGE